MSVTEGSEEAYSDYSEGLVFNFSVLWDLDPSHII